MSECIDLWLLASRLVGLWAPKLGFLNFYGRFEDIFDTVLQPIIVFHKFKFKQRFSSLELDVRETRFNIIGCTGTYI